MRFHAITRRMAAAIEFVLAMEIILLTSEGNLKEEAPSSKRKMRGRWGLFCFAMISSTRLQDRITCGLRPRHRRRLHRHASRHHRRRMNRRHHATRHHHRYTMDDWPAQGRCDWAAYSFECRVTGGTAHCRALPNRLRGWEYCPARLRSGCASGCHRYALPARRNSPPAAQIQGAYRAAAEAGRYCRQWLPACSCPAAAGWLPWCPRGG